MKKTIKRRKFYIPVHPGKVLKNDLKERKIDVEKFARLIRENAKFLKEFCEARKPLTGALAKKLSLALGTSPEFWFNLQVSWELSQVQDEDYSYIKEKFAA